MSRKPVENVEEIVWLENPSNYEYLREGLYGTTQRSGKLSVNGKLIGYENVKKKGKGTQTYDRRIWWLKDYDKGMPKENEGYGDSGLSPAEAVSPEDVYIPPGVKMVKQYEEEQLVPEVKSVKEKNELWRKSEREEKPFFVIEKKRKYAEIRYDMYNTPYDLTDDCREKLRDCLKKYLEGLSGDEFRRAIKGNRVISGFGRTSGFVKSIRIHEAREFVKRMRNIVMDKNNWILIEDREKEKLKKMFGTVN